MDCKEIGSEGVDWIDLAKDNEKCRTVVYHVIELSGVIKFLETPLLAEELSAFRE
jgi:hypothetical protein